MLTDSLARGAATVVHLRAHFLRLKETATLFRNSFAASERGFFTPTEDEQTRQLLVSYTQSRNALFELVSSFYRADDAATCTQDDRPLAVLIAYSGALILVDAGRFLRDTFHGSKTIRAKLNEPEPHFGIPTGSYDTVQKSLTNPVHAWHLYHASRFVKQCRDELRPTGAPRTTCERFARGGG